MLDDRDLVLALSPSRKAVAIEFLKSAGLKELAKNPVVVGGTLGAAVLAGLELMSQKKDPLTGMTVGQQATRKMEAFEKEHHNDSLPSELAGAGAETHRKVTDVFAKHPKSALLISALTGAGAGAAVGRLFKK